MARLSITVDSKGVPKAEKDLAKLNKQGKQTESTIVSFGKNASAAMLEVGKSAAGLATGIAVLTEATLEYTKELNRNANAAGLSAKQFQAMSLATNTVGISMEQLGGILGDTEEKIGDFLATGGGAFQDFADVMGLTKEQATQTAQQLQSLSGRDVLVEMVRQMEAAGVSAEKMNFALEGMASDARYLIPLLKDGASELGTLESKFGQLATTIDDETVKSLNELKTVSLIVANNMGNTLAVEVDKVSKYLLTAGQNAAFFWASLQEGTQQQILSDMATVASDISQVNDEIERLEAGESNMLIDAASALGVTSVDEQIDKRKARLLELKETYEDLRDSYNNLFGVNSQPTDIGTITGGSYSSDDGSGGVTTEPPSPDGWLQYYAAIDEARAISYQRAQENAQGQLATEKMIQTQLMSTASTTLASISMMSEEGSALQQAAFVASQGLALATTYMNTQAAAMAALAPPPIGLGPIAGIGMASAIEAMGAVNMGLIAAQTAVGLSGRSQGGQVNAGQMYNVGERGTETFIPETSGRIVPAHQAGQSIGNTVNIYNQAQGVSVQSEQNADGGTDVYVTREEFSGLMAAYGSDPDSDFNRTQDSLYSRPRS
ncbi:coil containing protein [Vibrio phage 1.233.A._10N.261.51.E6]|nr:coil containing protein [Vibrio phage 1.233.A._10N.261.51.E6]AUR96890.1 coil containing protein [Vibrio phage 1.233.B._10N.261.51.E6]